MNVPNSCWEMGDGSRRIDTDLHGSDPVLIRLDPSKSVAHFRELIFLQAFRESVRVRSTNPSGSSYERRWFADRSRPVSPKDELFPRSPRDIAFRDPEICRSSGR